MYTGGYHSSSAHFSYTLLLWSATRLNVVSICSTNNSTYFLFFWSIIMAVPSQYPVLLRTSIRLLAVLAVFGIMIASSYTPVAAQPCTSASGCPLVPYCNLTVPPTTYQVQFLLCCGTTATISAPHTVAPSLGPCPPYTATQTYIPPAGCRVVGIASILPFPALGYTFSPAACTLVIN